MRRQPGEKVVPIRLPALDGSTFDLAAVAGKPFMLSFFRFASCPFCNLRVHELVMRFQELGPDFTIVAVFDSSLENLRLHAEKHEAPFPILADADGSAYRAYRIERSIWGVLKGMVLRFPTLIRAMFGMGFVPLRIGGHLTTMPADFLVDRDGVIQVAYYGADEGDHLTLARVKAFAEAQRAGLEA